jgi:hypothetical protein
MRRAAAVRSVAKSSERSFDAEVARLALGAGQIFPSEAVLAIAKGLLERRVKSKVGESCIVEVRRPGEGAPLRGQSDASGRSA